ncbi:hypothetical protein ACMFMG_001858 [Clarireedia jacksonii]
MALPDPKTTSDIIFERSRKSLRSVKSLLEPCGARQVQKLFSSIHHLTSSPKTSTAPAATFPLFSQLPYEIREIIWTFYLSFPHIHVLELNSSPTAQNPWPLNISKRLNPHPSTLTCRESRALYHKLNWLRILQKIQIRTEKQIASQHSHLPTAAPFIACPEDDQVEWEHDILWLKGIATVVELVGEKPSVQMPKYYDMRRVAIDYSTLDCFDEAKLKRRTFTTYDHWLGRVLSKFHNLDEVYFVLDVEGDVNEKDGETAFLDVDVEMRVRRRLERVDDEKRVEAGLRFPQLDDRGLYPKAVLDHSFELLVDDEGNRPKMRYVYAKNGFSVVAICFDLGNLLGGSHQNQ